MWPFTTKPEPRVLKVQFFLYGAWCSWMSVTTEEVEGSRAEADKQLFISLEHMNKLNLPLRVTDNSKIVYLGKGENRG